MKRNKAVYNWKKNKNYILIFKNKIREFFSVIKKLFDTIIECHKTNNKFIWKYQEVFVYFLHIEHSDTKKKNLLYINTNV